MNDAIYVIGPEGSLAELAPQPYDSEALLQGLLAAHPRLLSGTADGGNGGRRWLLVGQETALADSEDAGGRWSVDHLFVDDEAVPTIVEVKRSTDTRIRREVVGQMLDYAANAVLYWPVEQLRATFEVTARDAGRDPGELLTAVVGADRNADEFWQLVRTNLQAGRIRLLFVADEIPRELRRIVEFLNGQMSPAEVLAIEIRQYLSGDTRALVPRLIGITADAERVKGATGRPPTRQWDEVSILAETERRRSAPEAEVLRRLMEWARPRFTRESFGAGGTDGSWTPVLDRGGRSFYPVVAWTYGRVEMQFQYMLNVPPFDDPAMRRRLLERLNTVPGVTIAADRLERRPSIALAVLEDDAAFDAFTAAIDWALGEFLESTAVRERGEPSA